MISRLTGVAGRKEEKTEKRQVLLLFIFVSLFQ